MHISFLAFSFVVVVAFLQAGTSRSAEASIDWVHSKKISESLINTQLTR